jgi:hypothetical protein
MYVAFIVALWAYVRICKRANAHAHDWIQYKTSMDKTSNGLVVVGWWTCVHCPKKRATCARLDMQSTLPAKPPRPE